MFLLIGFLVVMSLLSLPDLERVGRRQNENDWKRDGEQGPD